MSGVIRWVLYRDRILAVEWRSEGSQGYRWLRECIDEVMDDAAWNEKNISRGKVHSLLIKHHLAASSEHNHGEVVFLMEVRGLPVTYLDGMVAYLFSSTQCRYPDVLCGRKRVLGQDLVQVRLGELISVPEIKTGREGTGKDTQQKQAQRAANANGLEPENHKPTPTTA